jgi:hypothetical protein
MNNTLTDLEYNQEKVTKGLTQIKGYVEAATAENREELNMIAAKVMVESHIARVREAIGTLQRNLDILLQSITSAERNPRTTGSISEIDFGCFNTKHAPFSSPFPLSKNSINLIYRVCEVHVYIEKNMLGYVITLPLINRGTFKAYRMVPIPVALRNGKFTYVNIDETNLCIDQTRQYYFGMSNAEINNCKGIDGQTRLCKQQHPLLSSHLQETCAVNLLQPRFELPKNCETRLVQVKNTIWTQLDNNEWLYFAPDAESVTILCCDKNPLDLIITGVGKITLNAGCKGYSSFALLQTSVIVKAKSMKKEDILSKVNFNIDCLEELGIRFNTSSSPINLEFKHVASHFDDLRHASYKISELEKEISEQEWKNHLTSKHHAYSVIVYILVSILAVYALYKFYQLYKYLRARFSPYKDMRTLTAPLGEVQTRTNGNGNTVNINIKTSNESLSLGQGDIPLQSSHQSIEEDTKSRRSPRPRVSKSYF